MNLNKLDIQKMIDEADLDGDGKIDYGEFLVLLRERTRTFFKVVWFHLSIRNPFILILGIWGISIIVYISSACKSSFSPRWNANLTANASIHPWTTTSTAMFMALLPLYSSTPTLKKTARRSCRRHPTPRSRAPCPFSWPRQRIAWRSPSALQNGHYFGDRRQRKFYAKHAEITSKLVFVE